MRACLPEFSTPRIGVMTMNAQFASGLLQPLPESAALRIVSSRLMLGLWLLCTVAWAQDRKAASQPCAGEHAAVELRSVPSAGHAPPSSRSAAPSVETQMLIEQARTALEDNQLDLAERKLTELLAR